MNLTELPLEILDHIAGCLDSPADIRNFAQVSTRLYSVAFPRHTLRIIRAPLLSSIWEVFVTNHSLAQNVRTLELQRLPRWWDCGSIDQQVIPSIFEGWNEHNPLLDLTYLSTENDNTDLSDKEWDESLLRRIWEANLSAERVFVSALRNMTGLTTFIWSHIPPLIDPNVEDDVWTTIERHCPNLRQVHVLDGDDPDAPHDWGHVDLHRIAHNPNFFALKNLTTLITRTWAKSLPNMDLFPEMLVKHNPELEVLHLTFYGLITLDVSPLLSHSHWESLRQLHLSPFFAPACLLSSFLASHPIIDHLTLINRDDQFQQISVSVPPSFVLPPDSLPSLKYIDGVGEDVFSILSSPTTYPRPLEEIRGPVLDDTFLDLLEKSGCGPTLKRLKVCIHPELIVRLAKLSPGIEWLDLAYRLNAWGYPQDDWFSALAHLPSLTGLSGLSLPANTETLRALISSCPKLRRFDLDDGWGQTRAIVIEREGRLVTWELRERLDDDVGDLVDDCGESWGENPRGSFEI